MRLQDKKRLLKLIKQYRSNKSIYQTKEQEAFNKQIVRIYKDAKKIIQSILKPYKNQLNYRYQIDGPKVWSLYDKNNIFIGNLSKTVSNISGLDSKAQSQLRILMSMSNITTAIQGYRGLQSSMPNRNATKQVNKVYGREVGDAQLKKLRKDIINATTTVCKKIVELLEQR